MNPTQRVCLLVCPALVAMSPGNAAVADVGHLEIVVGRSAAGVLRVETGFDMPVELAPSIFVGFDGWAQSLPGFASLELDEPLEDMFRLAEQCDIEIVLTASDPGIGVTRSGGPGFMQINEAFLLGPPFFDAHPIWNIPSAGHGDVFTMTFFARDRANVYGDSEPFTLSFTPAPCHGDLNKDGSVDTLDLVALLGVFGQSIPHGQPGHEADVNHDGTVDTLDLTLLLGHYGEEC